MSDDLEKLYDKALRFLSFRPRSEKEIIDYLSKKTKKALPVARQEKIKDKVLFKLKKQNLINDNEFADWWIDQRMSLRPKGKIALEKELLQKGISRQIIENKLSAISNQQLIILARKLIKKKLKLYKNLAYLKRKKKLSSFLARRGFDWQTINLVMDAENEKHR